ncbi:MAG: cysteine desulfurase NifS [Candidatus Aenigmarchaeota archaeon]|nr:cysteine desulfurase NifS [Candidatus Aenigmarchaeota archaeon]
MKYIYMDHAATTPVDPKVMAAMTEFFDKKYGNPGSIHKIGQEAKTALNDSRNKIAKFLGVKENEIIFTSGGTESDNIALKGTAFANKDKGKHIITSKIEHHAVLHPCEWLEKHGFSVTYLPVDKHGLVNPKDVDNAIRKDTIIVSIMHANNEIGTIEPIEEISKICKRHGVYFHTDAVQTFGHIPIDIKNIDLLSVSAHKLYGPKGVGLLFVRDGVKIEPVLHGGGQENGMRSGTENIAGIVGFAKAVELAKDNMKSEMNRLTALRDKLIRGVLQIPDCWLNGHPEKRLPGNANFSFKYIEGESLVLYLDMNGIAASTGSACSTKSLKPSHVLTAIGLSHEEAHGSLRLALGRHNTDEDVDYALKVLPGIVSNLRKMSPLGK